jgi:hypothetical protein
MYQPYHTTKHSNGGSGDNLERDRGWYRRYGRWLRSQGKNRRKLGMSEHVDRSEEHRIRWRQ